MGPLLSSASPGAGLEPQDLVHRWKRGLLTEERPVLEFYKHKTCEYRCFSNFFQHADFVSEVPEAFCARPLEEAKRRVRCAFSEKAIMLCKAAGMGDLAAFDAIAESTTPGDAKRLGRSIQPFDQASGTTSCSPWPTKSRCRSSRSYATSDKYCCPRVTI